MYRQNFPAIPMLCGGHMNHQSSKDILIGASDPNAYSFQHAAVESSKQLA